MPGPKGITTVKGSFELSDICDKEFQMMAQSFSAIAEYGESKGKAERGASSTPSHTSLEAPIDDTPKAKKNFEFIPRTRTTLHQTSLGLLLLRQHSF
jgi:hypothetical protein